jgi:hypothetical protein
MVAPLFDIVNAASARRDVSRLLHCIADPTQTGKKI